MPPGHSKQSTYIRATERKPHHQKICELYETKPLYRVQAVMRQGDFDATIRQYKRKLRMCKVTKNERKAVSDPEGWQGTKTPVICTVSDTDDVNQPRPSTYSDIWIRLLLVETGALMLSGNGFDLSRTLAIAKLHLLKVLIFAKSPFYWLDRLSTACLLYVFAALRFVREDAQLQVLLHESVTNLSEANCRSASSSLIMEAKMIRTGYVRIMITERILDDLLEATSEPDFIESKAREILRHLGLPSMQNLVDKVLTSAPEAYVCLRYAHDVYNKCMKNVSFGDNVEIMFMSKLIG